MTTIEERARIVGRIHKLMQLTGDRGASEPEAMTAAAMAADLLAQHNLTMSEIDVAQTNYRAFESTYGSERSENLMRVCEMIAKLTGTIGWARDGAIGYFGSPVDCETAHYLTAVCRDAMTSEFNTYENGAGIQDGGQDARRNSFQRGMADRLRYRLSELHEMRLANERAAMQTGKDLIVLKEQAVLSSFAKTGMKLAQFRKSGSIMEYADYAAGQEAGSRVTISRGVEGAK